MTTALIKKRRANLTARCHAIMAGNGWFTIRLVAKVLGCSETGASARIRDQRKAKFGGHAVQRKKLGGIWHYHVRVGK
jgi:hypothetical protein